MKQLILLIFILKFSLSLSGQVGDDALKYDTCHVSAQQFVGNWLYVNGIDTVRLNLRLHRGNDNYGEIVDIIYGWHEYKKGNIIVESIFDKKNIVIPYVIDTFTTNSWSVAMMMLNQPCSINNVTAAGTLADYSRNATDISHSIRATLDATRTKLTTEITMYNGWQLKPWNTGITLPRKMTFVKQ
jgi:hypothetical protein